jgi:hypothetical protein
MISITMIYFYGYQGRHMHMIKVIKVNRTTRMIPCDTCLKLALHPKQLAQRSLDFIFHFVASAALGTQLLISSAYV